MNLPERKALSVAEFVAITGLGRQTVYRLIERGDLRAVKFGESRWLIPVTEVARLDEEAPLTRVVEADTSEALNRSR
jgi:excisionase family DNA binding protein